MVVVHGLCYTVEFSVVFLTFILGFDFLIQFYEGHLLVEANNRILLNLLSFIPSNMLRKEKLVNEAKVVMAINVIVSSFTLLLSTY